jgi:hypothetical protein
MMSRSLTSESRTSLWTTMSRTSLLSFGTKCVGCCGAEISKLQWTNKSRSLKPEQFETLLFQTGCFAFRSPAKMDLILRFKRSVRSASPRCMWRFIKRCKQYFNMYNRYAKPCCFKWNEGRQFNISMWDSLLWLQRQSHPYSRLGDRFYRNDNLECITSYVVSDVSQWKGHNYF